MTKLEKLEHEVEELTPFERASLMEWLYFLEETDRREAEREAERRDLVDQELSELRDGRPRRD